MDDCRPGYYAVIPADVRYDDRIPANAKLMYGEISALIGKDGFCFASNSYFSRLYQLSERTISKLISSLHDKGYISLEYERDTATGQILARKIFLRMSAPEEHPVEENFYTPGKNLQEGMEENFQDTGTSITDISKENKKESPQKKQRKKRAPPEEDFDPLPPLIDWIKSVLADKWEPAALNSLYAAFVRFVENRKAIKKPMKTKGAVTALCNRLARLSGADIPTMIDLLDTATCNGWQTVYAPKEAGQGNTSSGNNGREWECL